MGKPKSLEQVVTKPGRLTGADIVFLREGMGLDADALAPLLGIKPPHLGRAERNHLRLGYASDRLLRALAVTHHHPGPPLLRSVLHRERLQARAA